MRIKLDENMPAALGQLLGSAGRQAETVLNEGLSGADDALVLAAATNEGRVLLTFDTDFGNIRDYPLGTHSGVVVFRLRDQRWAVLERPARRAGAGVPGRARAGDPAA